MFGFNPRTPAGCDRLYLLSLLYSCLGFNPRTPAGCDDGRLALMRQATKVSIHAPLRGATRLSPAAVTTPQVSIHAPLRGATGRACLPFQVLEEFQSTHPCGVRRRVICSWCHSRYCFNPRTPAGCDGCRTTIYNNLYMFQSTHPCGVRPTGPNKRRRPPRSFNPRTPAGCDQVAVVADWEACKFQSTHPCGVRQQSTGS